MDLSEVTALLDPKPLQLEMGYERLPSGGLHVAVRTDMHGCTGEMLEWWVRWRCDTQKYIWWHPIDHTYSSWQGNLSDDTHIGSEHVVTEYFSGQPADDLVIQFRDPSEFFDEDAYSRARESGAVSGVVVGRLGVNPQSTSSPGRARARRQAAAHRSRYRVGDGPAKSLLHRTRSRDTRANRGTDCGTSNCGVRSRTPAARVRRVHIFVSFPAVALRSRKPGRISAASTVVTAVVSVPARVVHPFPAAPRISARPDFRDLIRDKRN